MNWPGSKPEASKGEDGGPRSGAMPPQCPRCEVTKNQFNRTIQNYQKAYRKKVEGLKTELRSVRNTNEALRKQVRNLKRITRLHAPSLVAGALLGALISKNWTRIVGFFKRSGSSGGQKQQAVEDGQAAAPEQQQQVA